MTFGRFSTYQSTIWMNYMEASDKWLSIVSADPLVVADPQTSEVVGGTVARMEGSWTRTSATSMTLNSALTFRGLPAGAHVAGVAGFDAEFNGNLLFSDLLDEPVDFPNGGTYVVPAGEYVIGIDIPMS
jgi:hypothetical protein